MANQYIHIYDIYIIWYNLIKYAALNGTSCIKRLTAIDYMKRG